jgi:type III secretory pathway component EscR
MEKVIMMIPVLIVIGGLGVVIGMYISSQIKCHIRKNIFNNNIKEYEQKEKTK